MFPNTKATRPFIAAFLRLIHEATGNVYGAVTYRRLLQTHAPEYRPGSTTIQSEIEVLKNELASPALDDDQHISATSFAVRPQLSGDGLASVMAGLERVASSVRATQPSDDSFHQDALVRTLEAENERLRSHSDYLQRTVETLQANASEHALTIESLRTERDTYKSLLDEQANTVAELAAAVEKADAQVSASHRFALGRIEDSGAETRRIKEQLSLANAKIEELKKKVQDETAMSDTLRRALNAQRSKET
ncbi:hypothetical protein [Eoetvoesiella caeni]|nr:hypothetical protein [Eoetvoesiella caeni]MCI2811300.1 hypothetical protein [Eoetvoesiella caeni]NYT57201.1 hypothetical protein [Eoetvoesiella caeni]